MLSRRLWLLAFVVLGLTACAPAAVGTSANNPYPATAGTASVRRGETVFIRVDYPLQRFDLAPADLKPSLWVPSGYDSEIGDVTGQFGLVDVRVADSWQFELLVVRIERSSERGSGAFDADRTVYSMWAVYEATAPEEAIPGPYRLRGTLRARGAGEQNVSLQVELRP